MLARACVTFAPAFAGQYYSTCAVGFSAVLFGMKVVLNSNSPGWSSVAGISLPTKVSTSLVCIVFFGREGYSLHKCNNNNNLYYLYGQHTTLHSSTCHRAV